ncbi:MAG: hypothetical protein QOJ01_274 [Solirubrobacterales bacterium]|nr:hypothetical protein [Solirubrobacterales bacterium]
MTAAPTGAPDAVAPPPHHPRFPLIDGVRAIAVISIVVVHSAGAAAVTGGSLGGRLLAHLNVGVAIFFVVSGFLLYRPFVAHRAGGADPPAVSAYAKRRVLRIFPAYWLALLAFTVLPGLTGVYAGHWLAQVGLVQTLPAAPMPSCTTAPQSCDLAQTWSLVVEATFYLLLPVFWLVSERLYRALRPGRWVGVELLGLACLAAVSLVATFSNADGWVLDWVRSSALGYGLWFAFGMGMATISATGNTSTRGGTVVAAIAKRPWLPWLAAAALYLGLALDLPPTAFLFNRGDQLLANIAFGLIALLVVMPAVFGAPGRGPGRILGAPAAAWLGLISYGMFLWHYVFTVKLGTGGAGWGFVPILAVALAGSIACAAVSYYALERPVLRLKYSARDRTTRR